MQTCQHNLDPEKYIISYYKNKKNINLETFVLRVINNLYKSILNNLKNGHFLKWLKRFLKQPSGPPIYFY